MPTPSPSWRNRVLLVPVGACWAETARGAKSRQLLLAEVLTAQVAQMRPVKLHPWTSCACLDSVLVDAARLRGTHHMLVLPWHLPQATDALVACASHALQRAGAEPASITSQTLKRPVISVQGVLPAGPLGGLLPPQPRLDRLVERWPGWSQDYTLVCTGRATILVQHATALPRDMGAKREQEEQLERALWASLYPQRSGGKSPGLETMLGRDAAICAHYLRDIMCAACDLLYGPPSSPGVQWAEERLCQR